MRARIALLVTAKRIASIFCMRLMVSMRGRLRPATGLRVLAAIASSPLPRQYRPGSIDPISAPRYSGALERRRQGLSPRYLAALAVKIVMDQLVISGDLAAVAKPGSAPSTAGTDGADAAASRLLACKREPKAPFPDPAGNFPDRSI